jgi:hypothetical protein
MCFAGLSNILFCSTNDARLNSSLFSICCSFDLSREVVAVSLDIFDRYLATRGNACNGNLALLVSLTTLHIAIKLFDSKKIKLQTLANLSRGQFGSKSIEEMEWKVLAALRWKLHPPTPYAFVSHLLLFLPNEANPAIRKELFEMARYFTELAVCDSYFVDVNNSTVAFAAILNVINGMTYSKLSAAIRERFLLELRRRVGMDATLPSVLSAMERLRTMFVATGASKCSNNENTSPAPDAIQASKPPVASSNQNSNINKGSLLLQEPQHDSRSVCSTNSNRSKNSWPGTQRGGSNSLDGYRYSPSPARRVVMAGSSPMRASMSSSPMDAGVQ